MKALIVGDIHAAWGDAQDVIAKALEEEGPFDCILQVGDMGFAFPGVKPWKAEYEIPCKWIDGNHENHEMLGKRDLPNFGYDPYHVLWPNEWKAFLEQWEYMPRGSVWEGILFIGGAKSQDRFWRTSGVDYWPEENLSREDEERIFDIIEETGPENIHTVISHDCPSSFEGIARGLRAVHGPGATWETDHNNAVLEEVRQQVQPDRWFFGHYHFAWEDALDGCQWKCINMVGNSKGGPAYAVLEF